jgi:D-3-phosphoglycerate dehydrogenase / 2-oxoglutarate reductase
MQESTSTTKTTNATTTDATNSGRGKHSTRILVADPIATAGVTALRAIGKVDERHGLSNKELISVIGEYDALVVRSETKVTAQVIEAGTRLRVIARAGVGVDNIDVEAASRHGIVVVNSPTGNIVAAAEHTLALLFALARHIPMANASLRAALWQRTPYMGTELRNKTLGIVGLGKVGLEVARRSGKDGLQMHLLAADPYAVEETARKYGVELLSLEELLPQVDFLTVHTALTSSTRGLISGAELAKLRPTSRVINCARGGVIDEEALLKALETGRLAGAALDVFTKEPPLPESAAGKLIQHPLVVATPHLGASTEEAQVNVAVEVAEQIREVLRGGTAQAAVNVPLILPETLRQLQPWMALVEKLGRLYTQLHPGPLERVELSVSGEIAAYDTRPLTAALIKGLLESVSESHVNLVNAPVLARDWGLEIVESRSTTAEQYANLVEVRVQMDTPPVLRLAATITWGEEHIVRVDQYATDFVPQGYILFCRNLDRPGMIGRVGTILGDAGVNIGHMDVGPIIGPTSGGAKSPGGEALMVLSVDDAIPESAIEQIRQTKDIFNITSVRLG